jgi:phage recombination protein Bet
MSQQQDKPKPKQRELTAVEIQEAKVFASQWDESQIKLIWLRKMPAGCNLSDLQMFIYACEVRGLNPLLSEAYARLQFDRDTGEMRLLVLDSVHGLLKLADKTGEMNGIKTTYQEDDSGKLISASTQVWRKGCDHPFEFVAYWDEFVGLTSGGAPSFMWKSKPRVMLGKCSISNALRLAFAAALAGVFVPEELDHTDNAPDPDSEFAVGEIKSEVETVVEPSVQRLDPDVPARIDSTSGPQTDAKVGTTSEPSIAQPKEKIDAQAMPINEVKQKNSALVQRLMLDLQISKEMRQPLLTSYYQGYLGVDTMPKDATVFTPALLALSQFSDATRNARIEFVADAKGLGAKLRADKEFENATA